MIIGITQKEQQAQDELRDYLWKLRERYGEYFDMFSQIPIEPIGRKPKCMLPGYVEPVPNKTEEYIDPHPEIKPFKHRAIGWISEEDLEEMR